MNIYQRFFVLISIMINARGETWVDDFVNSANEACAVYEIVLFIRTEKMMFSGSKRRKQIVPKGTNFHEPYDQNAILKDSYQDIQILLKTFNTFPNRLVAVNEELVEPSEQFLDDYQNTHNSMFVLINTEDDKEDVIDEFICPPLSK